MIPDMPFPDDVASVRSGLVNLNDHIGVELVADRVRVASRLDSLGM